MKMVGFITAIIVLFFAFICFNTGDAMGYPEYRSPDHIAKHAHEIAKRHKDLARLHELGESPGGRKLFLLELGRKGADLPAVFVVANMEGNCPPASEAVLKLADLLIGDWRDELDTRTWFLVPCGNPDGYARYFAKPRARRFANGRPFNDDNDNAIDEDGPDDLNEDGFITMMRQSHPEGVWLPVKDNPVLLKKAEREKGERGIYRLFTEGIDNDGDGEMNEDPPGVVNPGHNFPHNFEHYTKTGGPWAASEVESRAMLRFAFDHPEIAMVLVFGRSNSLREVPEGKKAEVTSDKFKIPKRFAERMGLDPEQEYPLKEIIQMVRDITGFREINEDMVLQMLGVGAATKVNRRDEPYWKEVSDRYNEFMKEKGLDGKRLDPPKFPDGSIDEWAYYQYGTLTFSMDFWTVPVKEKEKKKEESELTPDKIEGMSSEEFLELGEEKIAALFESMDTPFPFNPERFKKALEGGMITPKRIAEFMRRAEKKKEGGGADEKELALYEYNKSAFVEWQPYEHPTLGEVEIGGKVPWSDLAPPAAVIDTLIEKQLPFVRDLVWLLPELVIDRVTVEKRSDGAWQVEAWVVNRGFFPFPTHQGNRCKRPVPAAVTIEGKSITIIEGRKRFVPKLLEGSGGYEKFRWLIGAAEGSQITIKLDGRSGGRDEKIVTMREGGGA